MTAANIQNKKATKNNAAINTGATNNLAKKTDMTKKAEMEEDTMKKAKEIAINKSIPLEHLPTNGSNENEKYMWLNNADLQISPDIQRKLNPMRVAEIQKKFSPLVANPIKVSYRDGKYFIFDGMHTRTAISGLNGTDNFPIYCRVYYGLTKEDEARLFSLQFGNSEPVSMGYRLRALAVAKDPTVLDFLEKTRTNGFSISLGSHAAINGNIAAVVAAFNAYGYLGGSEYGRMLKILHRTWAGEKWSVNRYMLGGMARLMKMYEIGVNSFVKAFREVSYEDILEEVRRFPGMTKDGAFAAALADIYDRNSTSMLKACV